MTTADPATFLETTHCRPDTVPSRVAYHHPLTEYEKQQAEAAAELEASMTPRRRFDLPPMPELLPDGTAVVVEPEPRHWLAERTNLGDVVYWVACFGGACLLLLCATH
jgi:hypothetical protein